MTRTEFAEAFEQALSARSLTLVEVHERLRGMGVSISASTLSYWRSGARQPDPHRSAQALAALEDVLGLTVGTLSQHVVGRSRRVGSIAPLEPIAEPEAPSERIRKRLDVSPEENLRVLSIQETLDVDAHLAIASIAAEFLVQCVQDRVESLGFVEVSSEPTSLQPCMRVLAGGSSEGPFVNAERTVFGYRLVLERPLTVGETAMVSVRISYPEGYPAHRRHEVAVRRRVRELLQWFRFTDGHRPDWFEEEDTQAGRTRMVTEYEPQSVHRIRSDFGPGRVTVRWGHIDDP